MRDERVHLGDIDTSAIADMSVLFQMRQAQTIKRLKSTQSARAQSFKRL